MSNLVNQLRNSKAYIPEYDFHGNEINVDDENHLYQDAANRIEELEKALEACHGALQIAFECDVHGGVFGIHHNDAVDADILGRKALEINHD